MRKNKKSLPGILIVVHNGRWDAYGDDTPRSRELLKQIQDMGGINESVEDGYYEFNIQLNMEGPVATLIKLTNQNQN